MKWYKSYVEQCKECKKTGNQFLVQNPWNVHKIWVCVPYKTYCNYEACRQKRIKEGI